MKHTILIADKFDAEGVRRLQSEKSFETLYDGGFKRDQLLKKLSNVQALVVRSATKVDAEVIAAAPELKIVVRAGVGVDNIDIAEASRCGIIVMNAPGGNSISTAEHAISLLMAVARKIPQANMSMKAGKWEKSKFKGVEITDKTLGVVGLGRIGTEVSRRALGLKMRVLGYDPHIPASALTHLNIEMVDKEVILRQSDFITVHTPLSDSTRGFINVENLGQLKDGVRVINCARGGIYDEEALGKGLKSGKIAAVALDVYSEEPVPADFGLREFENCIMTPHLGASTGDAEFAVAMETVDQVLEFFKSGVARNALNFPSMDAETRSFLGPFLRGGEKAGRILSELVGSDFDGVEIYYNGKVAEFNIQPITTAILRGALSRNMGESVNLVNAPLFARDRGVQIIEHKNKTSRDYSNNIMISFSRQNVKRASLAFTSLGNEPMVTSMFDLPIEFKPEGILLLIENRDVPRVVGMTGMFLGDCNINIASLELTRDSKGGSARCVITIDEMLDEGRLLKLGELENIVNVVQVDLRREL